MIFGDLKHDNSDDAGEGEKGSEFASLEREEDDDKGGGKVEKEVEESVLLLSSTRVDALCDVGRSEREQLLSFSFSFSFSLSLSLTLLFDRGGRPLLADMVTATFPLPPPPTPTLPVPLLVLLPSPLLLLLCPAPISLCVCGCDCVCGDALSLTLPTGLPLFNADVATVAFKDTTSPSLLTTPLPSLLSILRLFDPLANAKRNNSSSSYFCSFFDNDNNSSRDCNERTFFCILLLLPFPSKECSSSLSSDKNVSTNSDAVLE